MIKYTKRVQHVLNHIEDNYSLMESLSYLIIISSHIYGTYNTQTFSIHFIDSIPCYWCWNLVSDQYKVHIYVKHNNDINTLHVYIIFFSCLGDTIDRWNVYKDLLQNGILSNISYLYINTNK